MRWSQLRGLVHDLFDQSLDLKLNLTVDRGRGGPSIGRYWIRLNGEIVWEAPKRVSEKLELQEPDSSASEITEILREYIDTSSDEILKRDFPSDRWGVVEMLRAADRRIGKRRLPELLKRTSLDGAKKIIEARLEQE